MFRNLIVYPAFLAITLYLGILFSQSWAVLLFFAELVLFTLQIVAVFYQRMCLDVRVELPETVLAGNEKVRARIIFRNPGWLPVQRIAVRTEYRWLMGAKRNRKKIMTVRGNVDNWDMQSYELLAGPFPGGQLLFSVPFLRIYDYFGIFSIRIKLKMERSITILPELVSMPLFLLGKTTVADNESDASCRGQDLSELYNIREYQAGDPLRQIYWKRSAARDEMLFREGSAVKGAGAAVFLQLPEKKEGILRFHYFLKLAGSLMYSLLERDCRHFLVWESGELLERRRIAADTDIYEVLTELLEQNVRSRERPVKKKQHSRQSQELCDDSWQRQMELRYEIQFTGEELPETFFLLSRKTQKEIEILSAGNMDLSMETEGRSGAKKEKETKKRKKEKPALILIQEAGEVKEFLADIELKGTEQEMQQLTEEMRAI